MQQSAGIDQIGQAMNAVEQGGQDTARACRDLEQAVQSLQTPGQSIECFIKGEDGQPTAAIG